MIIIAGKLGLGFGDFGIVALVMNIGAKSENELVFGEFLDSFLWFAAILTDNAAKVALEENSLLCQIFEQSKIFPDGMIALWMGENHLIAGIDEAD